MCQLFVDGKEIWLNSKDNISFGDVDKAVNKSKRNHQIGSFPFCPHRFLKEQRTSPKLHWYQTIITWTCMSIAWFFIIIIFLEMPIMKRTAILLNIMAIFWYLNFPPLNFSQLLFSLLQGCMTGQKETK